MKCDAHTYNLKDAKFVGGNLTTGITCFSLLKLDKNFEGVHWITERNRSVLT